MKDTGFFVPEDRRDRLAATHDKNAAGKLIVSDDPARSRYLKKPTSTTR
jgi:hypothetical protein